MKDVSSIEKLEKFMNEVRLLSSSSWQNIVELQAVSINGILTNSHGQKRNVVYHVTQFAKYGEIFQLIKETECFNEKLARTYFIQLLKGLEHLHSIGISHRDIKPENLLLDHKLSLLIADFGSAARCRTESHKAIEFDSAITVGSQEYNAPEINMDKIYYGEKADLFSAGICLFYFLTGCAPFREASLEDPSFDLLYQKDKISFWNIYSSLKLSSKFRDLFERITDRDAMHRIELSEIWSHPWLKGEIYEKSELIDVMQPRLEMFMKMRTVQMQEKIERQKLLSMFGSSIISKPIPEASLLEKTIYLDPKFKEFLEECQIINEHLEHQISNKIPQIMIRSDDQILVRIDEKREKIKDSEENKEDCKTHKRCKSSQPVKENPLDSPDSD